MPGAAPAGSPSNSADGATTSWGSISTRPCSAEARTKAPALTWLQGDLADPGLDLGGRTFDLVVMAGNVLIFVAPGTEGEVIRNAARWLRPGGRLITGYSIRPEGFGPSQHDPLAAEAGLVLEDRWSTWDKAPYAPADGYAVAVHRREI